MNYLDIILAIPLLWSIYKGFTKGLIFSVASLLALVLAIYGSIHYSYLFEPFISRWFHPDEKYLSMIIFAISFIVIVVVVHLVAFFIDRLVKAVALGMVNRLAGVVFNLIKMAFILSIILTLLNYINRYNALIPEEDREESLLYDPVSSFAPAVFPYLKFNEVREKIQDLNPGEIKEDEGKEI